MPIQIAVVEDEFFKQPLYQNYIPPEDKAASQLWQNGFKNYVPDNEQPMDPEPVRDDLDRRPARRRGPQPKGKRGRPKKVVAVVVAEETVSEG